MLNYYLNATGDVHIEKYLKLLGIEPLPAQAARCYLAVGRRRGRDPYPRRGRGSWQARSPFESEEEYMGTGNRFCSFISETDGSAMDLTAFAGADGEICPGFRRSDDSSILYLGFEKPLSDGDRLYICIKADERRNPFDEDFRLCSLRWQFFGEAGWTDLDTEDGTCGFLKSGIVRVGRISAMERFRHPEGMGEAYYIRCILEEDAYDALPGIGMIYVNPLEVVQQKTVCKEGEILPELQIGRTDGCAGQELLFDYPDICRFFPGAGDRGKAL